MFGGIICKVDFSRGPYEIELAFVDSVFHLPVAHVERFGKRLEHSECEDALGGWCYCWF